MVKKYSVTFLREFSVEVEADDLESADRVARNIIAQFPAATCKLLSVEEIPTAKKEGRHKRAPKASRQN